MNQKSHISPVGELRMGKNVNFSKQWHTEYIISFNELSKKNKDFQGAIKNGMHFIIQVFK